MQKNYHDNNDNKKNNGKTRFSDEAENFYKNKNIIRKIKNKKNKKNKRLMLFIEIAAVALILFVGFAVFSIISKFNRRNFTPADVGITAEDEAAEKQISAITNFLILGIDDNNISDCILIASLDKSNKKIKLISVLRDSLVRIEPRNKKPYYSKINEAYSNGNEETTLRTINKNLGLKIMNYVTVNFTGLVNVIDQLGGVKIKISPAERIAINGIIQTTKSLQKIHRDMLPTSKSDLTDDKEVNLNGSQAVAYSRIRKTQTIDGQNDDSGRTSRQRSILTILIQKLMEIDKSKIPNIIRTLLPNVKTSFDLTTLFNIYRCVKGKNYSIVQTKIPVPEYTIDPDYNYHGKSTVFYDLDYAGQAVNKLIYEDIDQESFIESNPPHVKKIDSHRIQNSIKNQNSQNNQTKKNSSKNENKQINSAKSNYSTNSVNKKIKKRKR